ncbi:MAG: sugar phosphate isomerase/epimerase [Synergistaceae bacterium]|jgi:sugar phosphate isomerase/epimerase|nr:sugar phosphate isomerase/epimerase [Synergistaceae bacterium]
MTRKFSLVHLTYINWNPAEMIYIASLTGFDCVSVRTICQGLPGEKNHDITGNNALFKATKQALADTGLSINDIELAKIDSGTTDIRKYECHLEAAASLGVKNVITNIWVGDSNFYTEKFCELCDIAKQYGITVNLEFVTWAKVTSLKAARKLIESASRANAAILLDTLHFHRSRVTLDELKECPKNMFRIVHLCDAPSFIPDDEKSLIHTGRAERFYPGDGEIDIAGIMRLLDEEITVGIEVPNIKAVEVIGATEHARRCLEKTKRYLKDNAFL